MSLHPPVLFIGDRPNPAKNLSLDVPFVGTKSYKTLLEWIYRMDIDINRVQIVNVFDIQGKETTWFFEVDIDTRIVSLGSAANLAVTRHFSSGIFRLPHPSGLNRELNDKKKLSDQLSRCKAFIYKKT